MEDQNDSPVNDSETSFYIYGSSLSGGGTLMLSAKAELASYQKRTLSYEEGTSLISWLKEQESACPNLVRVARFMFCIPGSPADN